MDDLRSDGGLLQGPRTAGKPCRLWAAEFEGEPADCRSLPYDVGHIDLRLASSCITGDHRRAAEGERCERFARQFSAHTIDDDIDTFAFGDTQNTSFEALTGEIDDVLVSSSASAFGLLSAARGGDHQ